MFIKQLPAVFPTPFTGYVFNADREKTIDFEKYFPHICNANVNTIIQRSIMPKTAIIQTRIDPKVKTKAQKILSKLNISMSEAISIFLTQVSLTKGIPFEIKIPNKLTEETLLKSESGKELHEVSNTKELLRELNN